MTTALTRARGRTAAPSPLMIRRRRFAVVGVVLAALVAWSILVPLLGVVWTGAAVIVLLVSLTGPLTAAVTISGGVSLMLLHLSVGTVLPRRTIARP